MIYDRLKTSTTLWLIIITFLASTTLVWFGKITPEVWGAVIALVFNGYIFKEMKKNDQPHN